MKEKLNIFICIIKNTRTKPRIDLILQMAFCKKKKKARPPLKPREGPYRKTNAYTSRPSIQQILTFLIAITVIVLHSVFIVAPIIKINHVILYVMLGLHYLLILALIVVYAKITMFDPVDTFIVDPNLATYKQARGENNMTYCNLCRSFVHEKSYHCKRCKRCTEDFDHHCVFLNNCIGSLNYEMFMQLLLLYIVFLLNVIGQCIWVFVAARENDDVRAASITEWMAIAIIIFCILQLLATTALLVFHCYISCCLDLTTIAFVDDQTNSYTSKIRQRQKHIFRQMQRQAYIQQQRQRQREMADQHNIITSTQMHIRPSALTNSDDKIISNSNNLYDVNAQHM